LGAENAFMISQTIHPMTHRIRKTRMILP